MAEHSVAHAAPSVTRPYTRPAPTGRLLALALATSAQAPAQQSDIHGPSGSAAFGTSVTVLPNGNIVVTDPDFGADAVGAVYLYSPRRSLISTLVGGSTDDHVGSGGVFVVGTGNFVVVSPDWNNVDAAAAGAATWVDGVTGLSGVVSAGNSLVGTTSGDNVGRSALGVTCVVVLSNGNYVVASPLWNNGVAGSNVGAATWSNGNSGLAGPVSASNSLVGSTAGDGVGGYWQGQWVFALRNGNYVVSSPNWNNGVEGNHVGAATWGSGANGVTGPVSIDNSLIGTNSGDKVGNAGVAALSNGNYVVASETWHDSSGAATWGNGGSGITGPVSESNSLVGNSLARGVASSGVTALSNGNYVVLSPSWENGQVFNAGAATWGNGSTGSTGTVSESNSLVGTNAGDQVGILVTALSNGNYVVGSQAWNGQMGAATWGNGSSGTTGPVSASNSLVGTTQYDFVGGTVFALSNGNYVVDSWSWNNGIADSQVGAVTWGNGSTGVKGAVSASNSLVGSAYGDRVGLGGVAALSNGNYVVASGYWSNGQGNNYPIGAVTWGNGNGGIKGAVSTGNSLVGSAVWEEIGLVGVHALRNGAFVVASPYWSNSTGAVAWRKGNSAVTGSLAAGSSLIGTVPGDRFGGEDRSYVTSLSDGSYVVVSPSWNGGRGAATMGGGAYPVTGTITSSNSVLGTTPSIDGATMKVAYDPTRHALLVGRPKENVVSVLALSIFTNGFEL